MSKRAVLEADLGQDLPTMLAECRTNPANCVEPGHECIRRYRRARWCDSRDHKMCGVVRNSPREGLTDCDQLQLEVSDTGRGMSPEIQAKVFDPFFTTKSPGQASDSLWSTGLFVVLAGTIHIASQPDKGSHNSNITAVRRKPAGDPQTSEAIPASRSCTSCLGATILMVEDEDMLR